MPHDLTFGHRRLALCFDGTWNNLKSQTNVSRLFNAIASDESGCAEQRRYYDEGVGTAIGEKLIGGVLGYGLGQNVLEGYCWLINNYMRGELVFDRDRHAQYDDGDQIFLFGFSRGAYTARSLAGLLNRVGIIDATKVPRDLIARDAKSTQSGPRPLLTPDSPIIRQAWNHYRDPPDKDAASLAEQASASVRRAIARNGREAYAARRPLNQFKTDYTIPVKVRCIAVWDTVGALGIPVSPLRVFKWWYRFHDTELGDCVESAFHAVAVDEHREDFNVTLWDQAKITTQQVEQRWFPGAHANVGGGYEDDLLPAGPLAWIAERAATCGLKFDFPEAAHPAGRTPLHRAELPPVFKLDGNEFLAPVRDSYAEFLLGAYRLFKQFPLLGNGRCYRRMLLPSDGVKQIVDQSVALKWRADREYRPRNFAHAGRFDFGSAPANKDEEVIVADAGGPREGFES